jgi:uncharacterized protein YerC
MASKKELLTAKEVAEMFGYSVSTIEKKFPTTSATIKKKFNVEVCRIKYNNKTFYMILEDENNRALTLYQEKNDISIIPESLKFEELKALVFYALAAANQSVYRGTLENLLKYIEITPTKANIEKLNKALKELEEEHYIRCVEDKDYIIAFITAELEHELPIHIEMLRQCRKIAEENNKQFKKISQLIRVWQAVRMCEKSQPFTYAELQNLTGLSYKQIRDVKRLLETNDIFKTNRAGSYWACLGMNVDLNAFYDNDNTVDS